jgi:hypothetical protein
MDLDRLNNNIMTIENRKPVNFRFKPKDLLLWKKKAAKQRITLTEYIQTKVNHNNDKQIF